jgi:response regulator RpfG family c-di-GMP phosphodiesterase
MSQWIKVAICVIILALIWLMPGSWLPLTEPTAMEYRVVVVSGQVMPADSGVDLLKRLQADARFVKARTCSLTGQATHADTIEAINVAGIGHYIVKLWTGSQLM